MEHGKPTSAFLYTLEVGTATAAGKQSCQASKAEPPHGLQHSSHL